MVTFADTSGVQPRGLEQPSTCMTPMSPGLRRKQLMWQNAVKHIISQREMNEQVR